MKTVSLSELMLANCYDSALADAAKMRDVNKMAARFMAGACPTSVANPLHYNPAAILDLLDASALLQPELKANVQAVLEAMCRKMAGNQRQMYGVWMARQAAAEALSDATV
jgi:hypothetical protein